MNRFVDAMSYSTSIKKTENGAIAHSTSGNSLVDLFSTIGSLRGRNEKDIIDKFQVAFNGDPLLATKMVYYARSIRVGNGLGERRTPRVIWKYMAQKYPEIMKKNMEYIPFFGRWDDLLVFVGTTCEDKMWDIFKNQFLKDIQNMESGEPISLLCKWIKSPNSKNQYNRKIGNKFCRVLNMDSKKYCSTLSKMREYLKLTERYMAQNRWTDIEYPTVPSRSMHIHKNAFRRRDEDRFNSYLESLVKGETKINASTMYPYDLVLPYLNSNTSKDVVIEEQWKALPNYVEGDKNVIVMADVSGSMFCSNRRPIATSIGLAIYFAQRNKGDFAGCYMTFTDKPTFLKVKDSSLYDNVNYVRHAGVGYNTNLEKAFMKILDTAVQNHISQDEMPVSLVVVSDLEIDKYTYNSQHWSFFEEMKNRYHNAGYEIPNIVMWNVEARNDTFHASSIDSRIQFFSGQSPATFKNVLDNIGKTPYEAMVSTLSNPVYDCIKV